MYSIYCQRTWHFHMTARLASATGSQWQLLLQLWEAMTSGSKPPLDTISAATGWCYRLVPPSFIGWFMGPHLYKYFKIWLDIITPSITQFFSIRYYVRIIYYWYNIVMFTNLANELGPHPVWLSIYIMKHYIEFCRNLSND